MDKQTLSRITSRAPTDALQELAEAVSRGRRAELVKGPEKTLVLLTVREPVRNSRFYLGEALASHCVAELDGARGAAVTLGDDLDRAGAAALLDAAHTGGFPEFFAVERRIIELGESLRRGDEENAALIRSTQVSFHALEDREV
ncbi:MAG: phosphonate C-P lyase system protein PhnG [Oscillospiraceae bacterium]|jgi:alpha-D-ribose 1-methylphosphonate 5-triphosphate synthase subunit PhnG|nr:phosphonate C-P lyase system protein PhnG [Oscillospiraceae bacterium]